jgi:hypothetical protein
MTFSKLFAVQAPATTKDYQGSWRLPRRAAYENMNRDYNPDKYVAISRA